MEIIRKIVAPGHGTFTKPNPIYFAVHSTANPGATAANHVSYWSGSGKNYAVHLVSDWKEAYQCVEFDRICWQVGNGNKTCIGLEICEATNRTDFERGLEIARDVILQILNRYGWSVDKNVRSHKWFTENYGGSDHTDPIPYLKKWGWTWDKFIQYLKDGDEIVTPEQMQQIADKVWEKGLLNPSNNNWQPAGDMLRWSAVNTTAIKNELFNESDPTGRNSNSNMRNRIAWMAKKQEDQTKILNSIMEKLDKIETFLDSVGEDTEE